VYGAATLFLGSRFLFASLACLVGTWVGSMCKDLFLFKAYGFFYFTSSFGLIVKEPKACRGSFIWCIVSLS